eukprot:TRINITY_DN440_c0_g1_i1.p1 TRINITY_DN440_c0_g1~~TRINITY_DN440_c0_g1_i1.p1  ORF type:complete len:155 (-),score=39.36 TRINITY_DN440_c0_g1_i1:49-513(-)
MFSSKSAAPAGPVFIISNHNGHALDIKQGKVEPASPIIVWNKKAKADKSSVNQQWVFTADHYIHPVGNPNLVLDAQGGGIKGNAIILYNKKPIHEADNQRWKFNKYGQLRLKANKNLVIDIKGGATEPGSPVILWDKKKLAEGPIDNQKFHLVQ